MIHKTPTINAYVCTLKKCNKKRDTPWFFVVILTHLFYVLCYKNFWLIVFWNDKDLSDRLIITFNTFFTFIPIRNYYFSFHVLLLLLCFLFFILILFQINLWVIFIIFNFCPVHRIECYYCQTNTKGVFLGHFFYLENLC